MINELEKEAKFLKVHERALPLPQRVESSSSDSHSLVFDLHKRSYVRSSGTAPAQFVQLHKLDEHISSRESISKET